MADELNELTSLRISNTNYFWRRSDGTYNATGYDPRVYPQAKFSAGDYNVFLTADGGFMWAGETIHYEIDGLPFTHVIATWAADRQRAEEAAVVRAAEKVLESESLRDFRL